MKSASINCTVTLSKKLRSLLSKDEDCSVVLTADIKDGKGIGRLSLNSHNLGDLIDNISDIGETSIQIIPSNYADETPNSDSIPQGTIFSSIPNKGENSPVINRLAAVHPPERGEESHAIVSKADIKIPEAFKQLKQVECREWISNMEELVQAVMDAKGKKSDIDPDMAQNDRERAVLLELKQKDEAIDKSAWIVNVGGGTLIVNDLDIILPINAPYDLSNISARRIIMSRDLKALIRGGSVKFLSPTEKDKYILGTQNEDTSVGLPVFDSPAEAEAHMASSVAHNPIIDDKNAMDITESDLEGHTDEESMIINLTQDMPKIKPKTSTISAQSTKHTVHGNGNIPPVQQVQAGKSKSPSVNPIRKLT